MMSEDTIIKTAEVRSNNDLIHYGTPRRSGRYPWGSGKESFQRSGDFLSRTNELKKSGMSEKEVADSLGLTTSQLRIQVGLAKDERRAIDVATAKGLREKGYSLNEIADKMGFANDSSVRSLLNSNSETRMNQAQKTADFLKQQIAEKGMIDVGVGVERELGVSREKMQQVLYMLELEGYEVYGGGVPQVTNKGKQTNIQVLCPPGTEHKDIYDFENVKSINEYVSHDGGETFDKFVYPKSIDGKRIKVRYAEEGGEDKDGLVEIRRDVDDLSLGNSHYAQVRILVNDNKYIKGMAVYGDDLPDGYDIVFNTNKTKDVPLDKVLKNITDDPDNPFGSLIKAGGQSYYTGKDGNRQLSAINKRAEEGDWNDWSDNLPSQFLSKQNISLVNKQLNLAKSDKQAEFDEIMSLTNPTVKKKLLSSFADDCDAAAVHLKAAALPRQKYQVLIPVPSLKDTEVYAPNYNNGEQIALVRFPHGGTFEIPILTVNNKHSASKKVLGNTPADAIGINKKVADRLSGADFDGDAVLAIPISSKVKIASSQPLKGLEGFDPKLDYGGKKEGTYKTMKNTQTEMGKISNLITDMTLKGASQDELARAVRHSMVVIDAEKHKLDYKQSELDNNVSSLKKKYQGSVDSEGRYREGASTLLSRAKSETTIIKRKGSPMIDKDTGEVSYKQDLETYVDSSGKVRNRTQRSTKMAETRDAYNLVSENATPTEKAYADYANYMKNLGNVSRKEMINSGKIAYSKEANTLYKSEVEALDSKLNVALMNAPKERKAQLIANTSLSAKKQDNPDLNTGAIKKLSQQELTRARDKVGAKRTPIIVTDREWDAIQAGAISENKLMRILDNVDVDNLRQKATPRATTSLSTAKETKIRAMSDSGYSTAEIAKALGVSTSTVNNYIGKGGN